MEYIGIVHIELLSVLGRNIERTIIRFIRVICSSWLTPAYLHGVQDGLHSFTTEHILRA